MTELKIFIKILILLVFMLSLLMKPTSVLSVRCIEREIQALLKFKQGLIDHHNVLSSWGSGESQRECCEWFLVECSNIAGHVIGLDLFSDYFEGKISPVLIELQHLNYLDFGHGNNLTVDNLEWLSHLPLLKHLSLSGVNLDKINWVHPISKLSFLEELYLSNCQLGNTDQPAFDVFVNSSFSFLSALNLSENNLTSFSIFTSVFNLSTRLTYVSLSYNQLDGPIPDTFGELSFLEELHLTGNMFNGVPKSLGNLSHLSTLLQLKTSNFIVSKWRLNFAFLFKFDHLLIIRKYL